MTQPKQFSPRVWLSKEGIDSIVKGLTYVHHKKYRDTTPYISLKEHKAILAEARAEVWQKAAKEVMDLFPRTYSLNNCPLWDLFLEKAAEIREELRK